MALFTSSIDSSRVKFRFAEQYSSEGSNIQTGVNIPGAYRGANVLESSGGPDTAFRISSGSDSDSLILHQNNTNGMATVVRTESDVIMDMSSETWPIVSDVEWVVYCIVDYTLNTDTTAAFEVDVPGMVPDDAVILAHIFMEAGDTSILQSRIRTDGSYRDKVLSKKGLLIRKRKDITVSGATRFLLSGKISFACQDSDFKSKVKLSLQSNPETPLTGSNGGEIYAFTWYNQSSGGSMIGLSDLDEDGCYTDPWISIMLSDVPETTWTGTFSAIYWEFVNFEDIDTTDDIAGGINTHANNVVCKENVAYTDPLYANFLTGQTDSILSMIHNRIRSQHPTSPTPSIWTLLWRSNNATSNMDVDNGTVSVYFSSEGMLVCKGGYVSGISGFYINETGETTVVFIDDGAIYKMTKNFTSAPTSVDMYNGIYWDSWDKWEAGSVEFGTDDVQRIFNFVEWGTVMMDAVPDEGGREFRLEILRLVDHIRVYYTNPTYSASIEIACGCYWDDSASLWRRVGTQSYNSVLYSFSRSGFTIYNKDRTDSNWTTGWTNAQWSVNWRFAYGNDFTAVKLYGPIREEWDIDLKVVLSNDLIRSMGSSAVWTGVSRGEILNYRGERTVNPSVGDFVVSKNYGLDAVVNVSGPTGWGASVSGAIDLLSTLEGPSIYALSTNTIALTGWNLGIDPGAYICLRGDGTNKAWMVKEVYQLSGASNYTSCIVETVGPGNVPTSIGTKVAYYIPSSDLGDEVVAGYHIALY